MAWGNNNILGIVEMTYKVCEYSAYRGRDKVSYVLFFNTVGTKLNLYSASADTVHASFVCYFCGS